MELIPVTCKERRELERLIHACLSSMGYSSRSAGKVAREAQQAKLLDFRLLQRDYVIERARLTTLQECLAIHRRLHGCGYEPAPAVPRQDLAGPADYLLGK
jgi:hypothetical protein